MRNRYSESEARSFCERFATSGEDLALRVYTSRLIGGEPRLVMHGGGNTSVKSTHVNLLGDEIETICVKGSGWNLDSIGPPGFPALELAYLRRLRALEQLSDEQIVNELRTHLLEASAPNPSVETLLHVFLPHKFVDHSHADAILTLTNQPEGEELVFEALGDQVALVPYVRSGFGLAKLAADVAEAHPGCIGLVLDKHGLFTWGETARASYERHVELVSRAEELVHRRTGGRRAIVQGAVPCDETAARRQAASLGPVLRGALTAADPLHRRWILDLRLSPLLWDTVHSPNVAELLLGPPLTPDHVIRTKAEPLVLPAPQGEPGRWRRVVDEGLAAYVAAYDEYFRSNVERTGRSLKQLDPLPRVVVVEKFGIFCVGPSLAEARIAGDIFETTVDVKTVAPVLGGYEGLSPEDLFDVEYWSLEQAKLPQISEKPLQRKVALVTGAGGAIGSAVARHLAVEGACVLACDLDGPAAARAAERANRATGAQVCRAIATDVTDEGSIADAFLAAADAFGGIDLVVLNAGIAVSAPIDEISLDEWRHVLDVNLTGYFTTLREAVRWMKLQGTGGHVIVNASKNVFAPGAEFAAYSASKAGGHQLGKLAAIELAPLDIRVNMINPDAVFADADVPSGLWQEVGPGRAKARGLDPAELEDYYRQRNLLKTRVTADDVARAVLFFAREDTPTTGATLPVDGGIPTAFPR